MGKSVSTTAVASAIGQLFGGAKAQPRQETTASEGSQATEPASLTATVVSTLADHAPPTEGSMASDLSGLPVTQTAEASVIPRVAEENHPEGASAERPSTAARKVCRILVAEDDELISNALKSMLANKGRFAVVTVGDFAGLAQVLDQGSGFDSIILDLHMPGMSGLASVRTIKQKAADCPILVFTGDDQASAIELFSAGVSGVLLKTSGLAVINTALKKVLSGRRFIPDTGFPRKSGTAQARASRSRIDVRKVRRTLLLRGLLAE